MAIAESRSLAYDASVIIHLYNNLHHSNEDNAVLVHKDEEGNVWFKLIGINVNTGGTYYELTKIGNDGETYEMAWNFYDWPEELSEHSAVHYIYYRQE